MKVNLNLIKIFIKIIEFKIFNYFHLDNNNILFLKK